jgi:outer membrane protein assembly factor BamB
MILISENVAVESILWVWTHELLWKANTTGTNYEESAVTYTDGIAYIGSCSTHGAGHDKIFAVDTDTGEILWSNDTGPGYVGPVIDGDVVYIGSST